MHVHITHNTWLSHGTHDTELSCELCVVSYVCTTLMDARTHHSRRTTLLDATHNTHGCITELCVMCGELCVHNTYGCTHTSLTTHRVTALTTHMGWLQWVGSLKWSDSFAEYSLFNRALLQTRPINKEPTNRTQNLRHIAEHSRHRTELWVMCGELCVRNTYGCTHTSLTTHNWVMALTTQMGRECRDSMCCEWCVRASRSVAHT